MSSGETAENPAPPRPNAPLRTAFRFALLLLLAAVFAILGAKAMGPPRFAWGMRTRTAATPKDHQAYLVYGSSVIDDARLALSKHRIVYVPASAGASSTGVWPRCTGRKRQGKVDVEEELELTPP